MGDHDRSASGSSSTLPTSQPALSTGQTISLPDVLGLFTSSPQYFILDTRPLGEFLEAHLPRSANISIPSLIFKRLRKAGPTGNTNWDALTGFISTSAGKQIWNGLKTDARIDVVIVGLNASDEVVNTLRGIMEGLVETGTVRILQGGWKSVMGVPSVGEMLVSGELSDSPAVGTIKSLPTPRSALVSDTQTPSILAPTPRVSHHPSMPSLRVDSPGSGRALPSLSLHPLAASRRPPKLSLNLEKPSRSATLPHEPLNLGKNMGMLSIRTGDPGNHPRTPLSSSFQTLCHAQSKLPPSPRSFGDIKRILGENENIIQSPSATRRPDTSIAPLSAGPSTARNAMIPFVVSTILPSFLFLGPEITSKSDIDILKRLGVKRILNVALECNDDEGLMLRHIFERYLRVPMRDIVEESGVAKGLRDACDFLGTRIGVSTYTD